MACVIADRVKETTTQTGTGTVTLAGAVTGFQSFSSIGNGNTTGYLIVGVDANGVPTGEWETGIGTYTSSGTTLSRGVIASSNSNALVSFSAGTKHVMCCDIAGYMTPLIMATTANRAIQVADQTALSATAGNARGKGSADLQIKRGNAAQVASGNYSFIGSGTNNKVTGYNSLVAGGYGNITSANWATNVGGSLNTVSANYAFNGGGRGNTVSGLYAGNVSGRFNTASAKYSTTLGGRAGAGIHGQIAHSAGLFSAQGDAQRSAYVGRKQTTNGTQAELFLDNSSARLTIPNDSTWAFEILIVARRTDANDESAAYLVTGCIDRNASAATTALVGSITKTVIAEDTAAWDIDVDADTTNGSLRIRVTGETSKTINWVAYIRTVETTG